LAFKWSLPIAGIPWPASSDCVLSPPTPLPSPPYARARAHAHPFGQMFPSLPWRIGRAGLRVRRSLLSRQSTARTSVATVAMCALARPSPAIRWPLGRCCDCSFEGRIVKANRRCAMPSSLLPSRPAWQLRQDRPPTVDAERTARTMPTVRTTAEVKVDEVTDPEANPEATVPQTDNHMTPATSDPMAETPAAACHQRPGVAITATRGCG
jgi:hypothetical protein